MSETSEITTARTPRPIPELASRRLPWAPLVTGSADPGEHLTSEELIRKAGLDWGVGIRPLYRKLDNGEFVQHTRVRETYRDDNEQELGAVCTRYEPFSNLDAFKFGDALVETGQGRWVDAGMQARGRRVFMTMLLQEFSVLGNDPYELYLFLRASHDGTTAVDPFLVPFRVSCTNQMGMVRRQNIFHTSILHTGTIRERAAEAQSALLATVNYQAEFSRIAERLAAEAVSDEKVNAVFKAIVPENRPRRDDMIADMLHVYNTSQDLAGQDPNGYKVLNAVTEYFDHVKNWQNPNSRFNAIMWGEGARAAAKVTEMFGVN